MPKPKKDSYREGLMQEFCNLIEALKLQDLQKHFLRSRWLEQVLWIESRANRARNRYYALRLTTIIGGVIAPILVSLHVSSKDVSSKDVSSKDVTSAYLGGFTIALSGVVAISAAVEEFFHYGERWRNYRRSVESLKTQGWLFFELSGPYLSYKSHEEAFTIFANQVEAIIQQDVDVYVTQVVQEKKQEEETPKQKTL